MEKTRAEWPVLEEESDQPTIAALHLFSQIVGKVAAAAVPWRNHGWHVTLHLSPRGFRTESIHVPGGTFELMLDLLDRCLLLESSTGQRHHVPLRSTSVSSFYSETLAMLERAGCAIAIHGTPNELDPAVPFAEDTEARAYNPDTAERLLRALLSADRVFRLFRSSFLGKVSPVHFFWGSFDLAVTRFSGRPAPLHPGGIPNLPDSITREAYSHEVSSAGFWPGGAGGGRPFFYSYAYPPPPGFSEAQVKPGAAHWEKALGEFVLDYEVVRASEDPNAALLAFLESSYSAAADLGAWDRAALDCARGEPGVPRRL
jgi:hypothetical protein